MFSAYLLDFFSFGTFCGGVFSMACSCCFFVITALANLPAFAFAFGFGGGGGGCVGFGGLTNTAGDHVFYSTRIIPLDLFIIIYST